MALQLYKHKDGKKRISDFLYDELSLFLDSGLSFAIYHESQIIGIGMNLMFERFGHIKMIIVALRLPSCRKEDTAEYTRALEWHNNAAVIASQSFPEAQDTIHCWRHYQFLHLQHFCQNVTRLEKM